MNTSLHHVSFTGESGLHLRRHSSIHRSSRDNAATIPSTGSKNDKEPISIKLLYWSILCSSYIILLETSQIAINIYRSENENRRICNAAADCFDGISICCTNNNCFRSVTRKNAKTTGRAPIIISSTRNTCQ